MTNQKRLSDVDLEERVQSWNHHQDNEVIGDLHCEALARGRQLEELRKERDNFLHLCHKYEDECAAAQARVRTLEAENAALRGLAALDIGDGKG